MRQISLVIPVYFNEPSLPILLEALRKEVKSLKKYAFEFIFIEDGSKDRSFPILESYARKDPRVKVIKLTRNFGSQNAIMAGLDRAKGESIIIMGADLQTPSSLIPSFLKAWESGSKIVVGSRQERQDPWTTLLFARFYYFLIRGAVQNLPRGGFDAFLMDKKVKDYLLSIGSRNTLLEISILWSGYPIQEVPYHRLERPFGKSRWTFFRKLKLAVDSLTAYTYLPLLLLYSIGAGFILLAFAMLMIAAQAKDPETLLQVLKYSLPLAFLGAGLTLVGLGLLGEYLWRTMEATRKIPGFVVERELGFGKKR